MGNCKNRGKVIIQKGDLMNSQQRCHLCILSQMVRRYEKQNIESFLSNYYEKPENKFHSLPRYLEEASISGIDHQSLPYLNSSTGSVRHIRSESVVQRPPSSHDLNDCNFGIDRSVSAQNYSFPSSSSRTNISNMYQKNKGSFSDTEHANYRGNSHFYDRDYLADDITSELSHSNNRKNTLYAGSNNGRTINGDPHIKFFRYSSLRSLKKLINKLRGKKSSFDFSTVRSLSPHRKTDFPATDEANRPKDDLFNNARKPKGVPYSASYCNNRRVSNFCDNGSDNRKHLSTSVESGVNTDAESGQWKNQRILAPSSDYCDKNNEGNDATVPALTGIVNHGNTCYINAVVQCLSNTDVFAEYFLTMSYLSDLKSGLSHKNAEKYGSRGQVTECLADLLHALWLKKYTPEISLRFKQTVEKYSEQYKGGQQQDAQEFFIWLLDRVHEDLNCGVKRRYKLQKTRNKSEIEIASSTIKKHLEAHCSFISYQFHGLFLSSVVCPVCRKQSAQSDPLACVSLPVSQSTKKPLYVTMVFLHNELRLLRYGLNADITATFREVKDCLSKAANIAIEQIVLCELSSVGFVRSFADEDDVSNLGALKSIYAFETPNFRPQQEIVVLACNRAYDDITENRFGSPVALKVFRDASYTELCGSIIAAFRNQLSPYGTLRDIQPENFQLRLMDDFHESSLLPATFQLPLYANTVENCLANQRKNKGPQHLKIMIEWSNASRQNFFGNLSENVLDHKSALDLKHQETFPDCQTLNECLEEFTQEETLQWYCPDCRQHQERARKRTLFYWLPNILTIHLKRNKQLPNGQLVKLDPLVKFPLYGLDLTAFTHQSSPLVSRRGGPSIDNYSKNMKTRNGELYVDTSSMQNVFDLFAICNHHGDSPNSGHYTAYCRNPVNGFWYCFDDQSVTRIEERKLVTKAAYMLFYERKISRSSNASCHNSTESGFVDHWFFKLCSSLSRQQQKNIVHGDILSDVRGSDASMRIKDNRRMYVALPPTIEDKDYNNSTNDVGRLMSKNSTPSDRESTESSPSRALKSNRLNTNSAKFFDSAEFRHQHNNNNNTNLFIDNDNHKKLNCTDEENSANIFQSRIRTNSIFETDL